jgi:hypothetical protein
MVNLAVQNLPSLNFVKTMTIKQVIGCLDSEDLAAASASLFLRLLIFHYTIQLLLTFTVKYKYYSHYLTVNKTNYCILRYLTIFNLDWSNFITLNCVNRIYVTSGFLLIVYVGLTAASSSYNAINVFQ